MAKGKKRPIIRIRCLALRVGAGDVMLQFLLGTPREALRDVIPRWLHML